MKKIIAILVALAVVSMAFAQTVSMSNTVEARPVITVNGGRAAWNWAANDRQDGAMFSDTIEASGETGDGRGKFIGNVVTDLLIKDPAGTGLMNVIPRIGLGLRGANFLGTYKALDFLAFGFGTFNEPYAAGSYLNAAQEMPAARGGDENGSWWANGGNNGDTWGAWNSSTNWNGAFVTFLGDGVGIDRLKASFILNNDWFNKNTASFALHFNYDAELFGVSAKYDGAFGTQSTAPARAFTGTGALPAGAADTKSDYAHGFTVGVKYKGLKDLAVGINLGAAFDAEISKVGGTSSSKFSVGLVSDFDFRNNITDQVWARVGFGNVNNESVKVLPFGVGNYLKYVIGGDYDATFSFETCYFQNALTQKLKDSKATVANSNDIYIYPRFEFTMGKSTFVFGVKNDVSGHMEYVDKTDNDWAYTKLFGDQARVEIPVKWTYKF